MELITKRYSTLMIRNHYSTRTQNEELDNTHEDALDKKCQRVTVIPYIKTSLSTVPGNKTQARTSLVGLIPNPFLYWWVPLPMNKIIRKLNILAAMENGPFINYLTCKTYDLDSYVANCHRVPHVGNDFPCWWMMHFGPLRENHQLEVILLLSSTKKHVKHPNFDRFTDFPMFSIFYATVSLWHPHALSCFIMKTNFDHL